MNTIHKHFLVLLTISTTVWGNPAIESSIPMADQPSIQKNSLTKESWSKKKIAGLTAAAIFTSSIIVIKGKAQPTQDPQYAQEPQPLPLPVNTKTMPLQPPALRLMPHPVPVRDTDPCASTVFTCSNFILNFDAARFEQLLRSLEALTRSRIPATQPQQRPLLLPQPPTGPAANTQEQSPELVLADPLSASVFAPKKTCDSVYFIVKKTCDSDYIFVPRENLKMFKIKIKQEHSRKLTIPQILIGNRATNPHYKEIINCTLMRLNDRHLREEGKKICFVELIPKNKLSPIGIINQSKNAPGNKANPSTIYLLALALGKKFVADYLFNNQAAYSVVHPSKLPYQLAQKEVAYKVYDFFGVNLDNKTLRKHLVLTNFYKELLLKNNCPKELVNHFRKNTSLDVRKMIFEFLPRIQFINPETNLIVDEDEETQ